MRSPLLSVAARLLALAAAPVVAVKAAIARRRIVGHLAGFDDHLLRDIGLTRGDIDAVTGHSFREDPTLRLALMVREARAGRSASAREQLEWARMAGETEGGGLSGTGRRAA